jgi:hypothetical protein
MAISNLIKALLLTIIINLFLKLTTIYRSKCKIKPISTNISSDIPMTSLSFIYPLNQYRISSVKSQLFHLQYEISIIV